MADRQTSPLTEFEVAMRTLLTRSKGESVLLSLDQKLPLKVDVVSVVGDEVVISVPIRLVTGIGVPEDKLYGDSNQ